jgi:uncharacterized protein involved in propanediol utilization
MHGVGWAPAHHGEIMQGVVRHAGRFVRCLVTMPCHVYGSRAIFVPDVSIPPGIVEADEGVAKATKAAELALRALGASCGGHLTVASSIPRGIGMGSSTADVVAAVRAVAAAHGMDFSAETVAGLAVAAEQASDAIMFDDGPAVLFAYREGVVLSRFAGPLPVFRVVSVITGEPVSTLDLVRTPYDERDAARFEELKHHLRRAIDAADPAEVAAVATASARLNQRDLPVACFKDLLSIADRTGALGVQIAHSGSVAGLLYASDVNPVAVDAAKTRLEAAGIPVLTQFTNLTEAATA